MILCFVLAFILPVTVFYGVRWYKHNISDLPYYAENYNIQSSIPDFKVPEYQFINQDSLPISNSFTDGKIWVAQELKIISLTVNPETDTPNVLKNYAELRNIDTKQWQLVTGDKKILYRFARKGLFIEATDGDGSANDFIHSEKLVLIDRDNRIRGYYDGTESVDVNLLINDIQRLIAENN